MRRTAAAVTSDVITSSSEFRDVPLSDIHPPTAFANPRTTCDERGLDDLAASIRQHGVLQPVLLRPHPTGAGYELIAGARRVRAAALAELVTVPARIRNLDDQAAYQAVAIAASQET